MSVSQNFQSLKKFTTRAVSYLLDSPQPSLVAYTRYSLPHKYKYERPAFLELDEEATQASADHEIRPVMHPKRPLIMMAGYAEVINAGKTLHVNEDQSSFNSFVVTVPVNQRSESWTTEMCQIPCIYFGVFDGHAGVGSALFAYHSLHYHIKDKLTEISHMLVLTQEEMDQKYLMTGLITSVDAEKLIMGALEKAFLAMDEEIQQERYDFRIEGGCTALVSLFMKGKLFVCNAGDCRAVLYKDDIPYPLSRDHNPESERKRVQMLAYLKPALLYDEYTRYQFQHRCRKKDIGTRQLYRDHNMDGWALKLIDKNDLKPQVVCGEGKRARLLDTIGTTRGFGDHDLEVPYAANIKIKPFLLAAPEVTVYDLNTAFTEDDVLVLASDGLWEKLSNEKAGNILKSKLEQQKADEPRRYIVAAQGLVDEARGVLGERGWRMLSNETASYDDISTFVIPLTSWKTALDNVLKLHREKTRPNSRALSVDEYLNIPHVSPPSYSDQERQKHELQAIAKSYEEVKTVEIKKLENILEKKENASRTCEVNKVSEIKLNEASEATTGKTEENGNFKTNNQDGNVEMLELLSNQDNKL